MSKYWNKAWQKDSKLFMGTPDPRSLERELAYYKSLGYDESMVSGTRLCKRSDGLIRMAVVGPDYGAVVSAVNRAKAADLQAVIGRLTFYFICTRPRIRALEDAFVLTRRQIAMTFEAELDDGSTKQLTYNAPAPAWLKEVAFENGGRMLRVRHTDGEEVRNDAALVAHSYDSRGPWKPSIFDLRVHYIGRARGDLADRCALDRLESHDKYQRVMEEVLEDPTRNREVWLVLASGTTMHTMSVHDDPERFPPARLAEGDRRARTMLAESDRIDLTEALMIHYFKPHLNTQHIRNLNVQHKVLKKCLTAHLTGLNLVCDTTSLNLALYTEHAPARVLHVKTTCLV